MLEVLPHNQSLPVARVSEDGRLAMVLEDSAGEPLETILNQRRLDVPTCLRLRLRSELAHLVASWHAAHIIHRDLRPANFVLDTQQHLRLLDLGRAVLETQEVAVPGTKPCGDIDEYIGTTMDITERKRAEAVLGQRSQELARSNAEQGSVFKFTLAAENRIKHECNADRGVRISPAIRPPHVGAEVCRKLNLPGCPSYLAA